MARTKRAKLNANAIALLIQEEADLVPKAWKKTYVRAMGGRSIKAAVKAACGECMGWTRSDIRECDRYICPLRPYRPYATRGTAEKPPGDHEA